MFGLSATAIAAIGVGVAAVGAGVSAYGASEQASAQKAAANYNAIVAQNNAIYQAQVDRNSALVSKNNAALALTQRSMTLQRGEIEAQNAMRMQADTIGKQRASLAANGVDVTEGSALDLIASTEFLGQSDVNTIQSNAALEAWGYDVKATNFLNEASNQKSAADMAIVSGEQISTLERWKADNTNPTKSALLVGGSSLLSSASMYAAGAGGGTGGSKTAMKFRSSGGSGW
ncbi:MAG: hypothetical protein WC762_03170 [Methylobacter sp.]|jgi:hypothetical protein